MEKRRQIKIFSIVSLVFAVLAMTIGFAAFSATLNISSSATVTPNANNFKIMVYGLEDKMYMEELENFNISDVSSYTSTVSGAPILGGYLLDGEISNIVNNGTSEISLNNLKAKFNEPNDGLLYYYVVKNEVM